MGSMGSSFSGEPTALAELLVRLSRDADLRRRLRAGASTRGQRSTVEAARAGYEAALAHFAVRTGG